MSVGRPPSSDSPGKYREAFELYQLSSPQLPRGSGAADEIAAFLEWAVSGQQPGFAEGDIINIGALARGLGKSRNTAAKGVERLISMGMVAKGKEKSPYLIASTTPIFRDLSLVADEQISLTYKMESESHFGPLVGFAIGDDDPRARLLASELDGCRDPLVREARGDGWREGPVLLFQRLRTVMREGRRTACLAEMTFLQLEPPLATAFRSRVERLRGEDYRRGSLYDVLGQCGVRDVRAGRTHVSVGVPPALLAELPDGIAGGRDIDASMLASGRPLLKWTYGLFHPHRPPLLSYSICYVDADLLGVFIRKMDIELDAPRGAKGT